MRKITLIDGISKGSLISPCCRLFICRLFGRNDRLLLNGLFGRAGAVRLYRRSAGKQHALVSETGIIYQRKPMSRIPLVQMSRNSCLSMSF